MSRIAPVRAAERGSHLLFRERNLLVTFCLPVCTLALSACATYLHDDALQKQTDQIVTTYNSAKIPDSIGAAIDTQTLHDQAALQAVVIEDNADRDAFLAGPLQTTDDKTSPVERMQNYVIVLLRISANVTADFGNVTDSTGLGVARC